MYGTRVLPCTCTVAGPILVKSAAARIDAKPQFAQRLFATGAVLYQDLRYGKGNRLHNNRVATVQGKTKVVGVTCTICGTRKSVD